MNTLDLVTVSDYSYLDKGLALYDSIAEYSSIDFAFHYFAIDMKTYLKLKEVSLENPTRIIPYYCGSIIDTQISENEPYLDYCWSLSAKSTKYVFAYKSKFKNVFYLDSDIYFYNGIEHAYLEMLEKKASIGLIPHMHISCGGEVGGFNSGLVAFFGRQGYRALRLWENCVYEKNGIYASRENRYKKDFSCCGDQKYLELICLEHETDTIIFDTFLTAAPWALHNAVDISYFYTDRTAKLRAVVDTTEKIGVDKKLPLLYNHFSGFSAKNDNQYSATSNRFCDDFMGKYECKKMYDDYFKTLLETRKKYKI